MATNNTDQAKSAKEQLLELLEKKPKIYQDAVKWTLACWTGIRMSSLFEDIIFSKMDRTAFLEEFKGLEESGFVRLENDPKGTSEVIVHLSEQGRDEIVDLFYSGKEKKELKRLFRRFDSIKPSS
jgi:DNA-binding MarR family transcriptional regulator